MPLSPELERLAAEWASAERGTAFAALADGLRKAGQTEQAWDVAVAGVTRFPAFVPGRVVQAALLRARGAEAEAEAVLREARSIDPTHPLLREAPAPQAPDLTTLGDDDQPPEETAADGGSLVSESLAALYAQQGHLEQAATAYAALLAREPGNARLAARHAAVVEELASRRPLPYAAATSGGRSVGDWLGAIARHEAPVRPPRDREGLDAFYRTPPAPAEATTDFEAFQRWLEGLGR